MTTGNLLGGRYQVSELLGYGGMAEVHRGRDLRLGRDVAIKTLRTDLARDATFQMRFRREAQNAAALNHPAIVAVYDTGEERGQHGETLPYIVMEYVNGRTLKEILTAEGRIAPRRALELLADICAALEFSHRHGIIHRDIKPGNVMLTQTGQVKVMDFGIARALASGATTMTQTSAVIGTAQYLSPEQARGEPVDARSDVYATGCVLFELLCGHPPFVGDNPVSVAYQHVREDPRPPSTSNRDVTPDIDAIVLKALAKNPLNRYQSAGEMREDVMRAAAGRPVSAPPVLTEAQMTAMLTPSTRTQPPAGRDVARAAQQQRRRGSVGVIAALVVLAVLAAAAVGTGLWFESRKVTVPNITTKTLDEAQADMSGTDLKWVQNPVTTNCTEGRVVNQHPSAGSEVRKGSEVKYDYCTGPGKTTVPTGLIGQSYDKAAEALRNRKLQAVRQETDSAKPQGEVVGLSEKEGATVQEGSSITVTVSNGKLVEVPSVADMTEATAKQKISDAGLSPYVIYQAATDPGAVPGTVMSTSPEAGKAVKKGTTIRLFVVQQRQQTTEPSSPSPSSSSPSSSSSSSTKPPNGN